MKQITYTNVDSVIEEKCYGFVLNNCVGTFARTSLDYGKFRALCVSSDFTRGNGWYDMGGKSLPNTIKNVLRNGAVVFEFENEKELFGWIAGRLACWV